MGIQSSNLKEGIKPVISEYWGHASSKYLPISDTLQYHTDSKITCVAGFL